MSNPILRAAGANCAKDTSSTRWPWRYLASTAEVITDHTGWEVTPNGESPTTESTSDNSSESEILTSSSFSKSLSVNTNLEAQVEVGFNFTYQAFEDFDITVQYSGSVSSGGPSHISINGGDSSTTGSFSETKDITLPRAVTPAGVSVFIIARATGYPYADYPDVNPTGKTVSATLTVTLN